MFFRKKKSGKAIDDIFIIDFMYLIRKDRHIKDVKVFFYKDERAININGEKRAFETYGLEERRMSKDNKYYKIANRDYLFWISPRDYKRFKLALENAKSLYRKEKEDADIYRREQNRINLQTPFEYDEIDNDIYKCFIAYKLTYEREDGTLKQFRKIEDKIIDICKEHNGRYFKTAAKTAEFAIIFDYHAIFYTYVKELKDKGYKVTSFEKALEYFDIYDMWDFKTMNELRDKYIDYMKTDC